MKNAALWMIKLSVAAFLLAVVAGVFSWQLISLRVQKHLLSYEHASQDSEDSSFFYNTVGFSPTKKSSAALPMPVALTVQKEVQQQQDSASASASSRYTIQIKDAATSGEAQRMMDVLNQAGLPAFVRPSPTKGKEAYSITMGLFSTQQQASDALTTLKERTPYVGKIITIGK